MADASNAQKAPIDIPVDLDHLAGQTFGDRELAVEILSLFLDQSVILLGRLEGGCDPAAWHAAAHTLKGSAYGVGAARVASLAFAVERMTAATSPEAKAALEALRAAVDEANAFIRVHLKGG